jgi:hypothetical protein
MNEQARENSNSILEISSRQFRQRLHCFQLSFKKSRFPNTALNAAIRVVLVRFPVVDQGGGDADVCRPGACLGARFSSNVLILELQHFEARIAS